MKKKLIIGASLGDCIHVAGILNFLQLASNLGFRTMFLGPATGVETIKEKIIKHNPDYVAISYRLTPENGKKYLNSFFDSISALDLDTQKVKLLFGGLPELTKYAAETKKFYKIFSGGESIEECLDVIRHMKDDSESIQSNETKSYPQTLIERIEMKSPFPVIRAHFGLPDMELTIDGIRKISEAKVLDVISIAPDQSAQESLQRPEIIKNAPKGSGGVPIRTKEDLEKIYEVSRTGNFPLLRIYSGTSDLIKNAEMFTETINNAWAAIPIFWYSQLDGRGPSGLREAIEEHLDAIKWHAKRNIPVEINDPHQWGLRLAPDHLVVADAYLIAKIAKELGVKHFVQQLMFNTPSGSSWKMDLARIFAMIEIVKPLEDESFRIIRETRAGLSYLSSNLNVAKGQLAASTLLQMYTKPHIMHVVSFSEGDHAAYPEDIIESCEIVRNVIAESISGLPNISDEEIEKRKEELLTEAQQLIAAIERLAELKCIDNFYTNSDFLTYIVEIGLFDAPQLVGTESGKAEIKTTIMNGKCTMLDEDGTPLKESDRIARILNQFYEQSEININQNLNAEEILVSETGGRVE